MVTYTHAGFWPDLPTTFLVANTDSDNFGVFCLLDSDAG